MTFRKQQALFATFGALAMLVPINFWLQSEFGSTWVLLAIGTVLATGVVTALLAQVIAKPAGTRPKISILKLVLALVLAMPVVWSPFLFNAYFSGGSNLTYSLLAALGTAVPIAFYAIQKYWPFLASFGVFLGLWAILWQRHWQAVSPQGKKG